MKNFTVISKLGNLLLITFSAGEGAFSQVFKVRRLSDGMEYALKKVYSI